jgi:cruciform cutting endonuclease 1
MSKPGLFTLKLSTLKALSVAIGSKQEGTKAILLEQLEHSVRVPKLPLHQPSSSDAKKTSNRVLSLDMGLKNLAFCVCDVSLSGQASKVITADGSFTRNKPFGLSVVAWKRIAVTAQSLAPPEKDDSSKQPKFRTSHLESPEEESPYTPRSLSQAAYTLIKNLLPYNPDTILIERQRFRSNHSAAVTEWTLRVNMLEAMLWAVLRTLNSEKSSLADGAVDFPTVWDVSPKRVSAFWTPKAEGPRKNAKEVKTEKINVVKRWIESSDPQGGPTLSFPEEALHMVDAFKAPEPGRGSRGALVSIGKLDDLADCLLQAATWAKWEQNRRDLLPLMEERDVDGILKWEEVAIGT